MDYYLLTDLAATMGYHLAMSGAETFRVEDTVHRILGAYGIECEVFAIPNSISVSLEAANGKPLMVLRRIGFHWTTAAPTARASTTSATFWPVWAFASCSAERCATACGRG